MKSVIGVDSVGKERELDKVPGVRVLDEDGEEGFIGDIEIHLDKLPEDIKILRIGSSYRK
jgi:hypothetical protein